MPFKTPRYMGAKDARKFLKESATVNELDFNRAGVKHAEVHMCGVLSQEEYVRGWLSEWKDKTHE